MIPLELNYRDVYLHPQKCVVSSRKECSTAVSLGKYEFSMPVFPANMKSVINEETCKYLAASGWFYTMHRFGIDNSNFIYNMKKDGFISSISIGVANSGREVSMLKEEGLLPDYVTIDIANAWSPAVEASIKTIKNSAPETFLIVGNVASKEAVADFEKWGADAVKVGIAGGHSCITKNKTGFHRPMVTTVMECTEETKLPIIADGGIAEHGDIAKAIACGATMVMAGMLFSGFDESAGDIVEVNGRNCKEYFGSASEYNKEHRKNIEGKKILVDYKGSMGKLLQELQEDLQSSISYAGGRDLSALNRKLLLQIRN